MANLFGELMGAAMGSGDSGSGSLVSTILGSNSPLSGILGMVMGQGSPTATTQNMIAPVVKGVAQKLGLPPAIAGIATAFVVSKLGSGQSAGGGGMGGPLNGLLDQVAGGQQVDLKALSANPMAKELAGMAGLKEDVAATGIESVLRGLVSQVGKL